MDWEGLAVCVCVCGHIHTEAEYSMSLVPSTVCTHFIKSVMHHKCLIWHVKKIILLKIVKTFSKDL